MTQPPAQRSWLAVRARSLLTRVHRAIVAAVGGPERARVVTVLAAVGGLASADAATVGASATQLRAGLHISNTDIGLLVALTAAVGAAASVPFGVLADRTRRTAVLGVSVLLWSAAMVWSAAAGSFGGLLQARLALGVVTASAGPVVASLVGDYFPGGERGRMYSFIGVGELVGAGVGFLITGDLAALSWRAAFAALAVPALVLAWAVFRLPEPPRGKTYFPPLEPASASPAGGAPMTSHATSATAGASASPATAGSTTPAAAAANEAAGTPLVTDAQSLAIERGIAPDPVRAAIDPSRLGLLGATRYVLAVKTNVLLIVSGACAYYFLAGVQTFGIEFAKGHYRVNQALASLLMIAVGAGAGVGVLVGGPLGDRLLRRGRIDGRVLVAAVAAAATPVLFIPALVTRSALAALPYVVLAAAALSAQNPTIDAARLDIMPALLWGRAEGIRTLLRAAAQAMAPLLFGAMSDLLGGGHGGLLWTFAIMLLPMVASAYFLFRCRRTLPGDVATAAVAGTGAGNGNRNGNGAGPRR